VNYKATFIQVADDCPVTFGTRPPVRERKTVACHQFDLLINHPYEFTQEDVLFKVHCQRKDINDAKDSNFRDAFLAKPLPCLRASPLAKRYGWGFHFDEQGKVALVAKESEPYKILSQANNLLVLKALRSHRG